jgi:alkaline phosphatase
MLTNAELHVTYPRYLWHPKVLANATHSVENLVFQLANYVSDKSKSRDDISSFVKKQLIEDGLGIHDSTDEEIKAVTDNTGNMLLASWNLADVTSKRAQNGWSTHGHSGIFFIHVAFHVSEAN